MVSLDTGRTKKDIEEWFSLFIEEIKLAIKLYGGLKLVNFGTFEVRERKGRKGKHPITGKATYSEDSKHLHFTSGKEIREILNY